MPDQVPHSFFIRLSPDWLSWSHSPSIHSLSYTTYYTILYIMEDDRETRVDEAMIVEGHGDRERRKSWKHLDRDGGAGGGGG